MVKILAKWRLIPVAVQSIDSQIETISWRIAEGFSYAIHRFIVKIMLLEIMIGQKKVNYKRIKLVEL